MERRNKSPSSVLNSHSLLEPHIPILGISFHQKAKANANQINMEKSDQRHLMKLFFLQGKRHKAMYGEVSGVLGNFLR
jgi:hypothetical protein